MNQNTKTFLILTISKIVIFSIFLFSMYLHYKTL